MTEIQKKNKVIALFDDYRLVEDDPEYEQAFTLHPTINVAVISIDELKYHCSWDWQIPVWVKVIEQLLNIASDKNEAYIKDIYLSFLNEYESAVNTNNPGKGVNIIFNAINFLHELNHIP
jgi:hypothetical protein